MTTCLQAALSYAARGWPVLPLRGKIPLTSHGVKDATVDEAAIRAWFARWPHANVGIACGEVSGLLVVDVDARSGGLETIAGYDLPPTLTVATGGGGLHLYYQRPEKPITGGKGRFGPGVDCQSDGRYVVAPPSLHPESGKPYAWQAEDGPIGAFPAVLALVAEQPKAGNLAALALTPAREVVPVDVVERARRYVDTMRESVSGKGGHDALFRVCCALVNGFGLPASLARGLVDDYNAVKAAPPWSDKEIRHKIDDAQKDGTYNGKPRGCLLERSSLSTPLAAPVAPVVLADRKRRARVASLAPPDSILHPPGLVGETARWIDACSVYPCPILSVAAALCAVAVVAGRKYRTPDGVRPVVYLVGVAKSGVGKETGRQCAISLLRACGLGGRVGADEVSSAAALAAMLRDQPARLLLLDELGRLLESYGGRNAASFERQIVTALVRLWSSADGTYLGKAMAQAKFSIPPVENPHLTVYGTTTPQSLHRALTGKDVVDGVLNRMLLVCVDGDQPRERRPTARRQEPPEGLVEQLKVLARGRGTGNLADTDSGAPVDVPLSDEAWALYWQIGEYVRGALEADGEYRDLWVRAREQAARVALVLALGCGRETLEAEHLTWAWELVRWCTVRARDVVAHYVAEGPEDAARQAILRRLAEGTATKSQITRALWRVERRVREAALATVLDSGDAVCEAVQTAGRTVQVYRATADDQPATDATASG